MKQVLRKGLKHIVVEEVPDPVVSAHHVLVRPAYSLISSGTETASIHQNGLLREVVDNRSHVSRILTVMKAAGPVRTISEVRAKLNEYAVLGYSGAGFVAEVHPSVTDLKIGDRVAYGGEGTGHGETILASRNLVANIPENVRMEDACFTTLGAIALNAVRTSGIGVGDVVAVIGLGLVGQLIAQLVRLQGGVVVAVDLKQDRVDKALELGADHGFAGDEAVVERVASITGGRGVDCAIVAAASKSSAPAELGLQICRDRARMVIVGALELNLPWDQMYMKEIQLFMSRAYGPGSYDQRYEKEAIDYPISYVRWTENRNMDEFLRLVDIGRVKVGPLVSHEFALEEAATAYQTILGTSSSLAVLLRYPHLDNQRSINPGRKIDLRRAPTQRGEIGVALAGAGNLARWAHLPSLRRTPNARLHAVCSANGARARNYGERFGAAYCTSDYRQVLDDPAVDLVMITSRNSQHAAQALDALRAGKHVFVEKPMALTEEQCRDLQQEVRASGRLLTVGFNRRFAPYYRTMKEQLSRRSGPALLNVRMNTPGISGSYWMADESEGGAILGEACHFIDLMYWLLDEEPVEVSAYSLPTTGLEPRGEHNIAACFRFENGSVGNLTYATVGSATSAGERVEALVEGIGVVVEDFKRLTISGRIRREHSRFWPEKGYRAQVQSLVSAVRTGAGCETTVIDGTRATVGCIRMLESARSGQPRAIDVDRVLTLKK
ncbi:MAG TPA: bi-domain-containing oxidoreductase [Blastocatellia bacterium]|nr:bi-domain-containing oxidoreductase [Blastocatellia bacterium]